MKISHAIVVDAPADRVWRELYDLRAQASCVEGSSVEDRAAGAVVLSSPAGEVLVQPIDRDEVDRIAHIRFDARQSGGPGVLIGILSERVTGDDGKVVVELEADLSKSGLPENAEAGFEPALAAFAERLGRDLEDRASRPERVVEPAREPATAPTPSTAAVPATGASPSGITERLDPRSNNGALAVLAVGLGLLIGILLPGRRKTTSINLRR